MMAHLFSHQHQFSHVDHTTWMHQTVAAQAAQTAAQQQQHFRHPNHNPHNHTAGLMVNTGHGQEMENVTEDNRRVLGWISDLLNEETREAALLELSKKREQVPELALILWHSFGEAQSRIYSLH
jgi:CCR4-NOT transcription complex subunit 9